MRGLGSYTLAAADTDDTGERQTGLCGTETLRFKPSLRYVDPSEGTQLISVVYGKYVRCLNDVTEQTP